MKKICFWSLSCDNPFLRPKLFFFPSKKANPHEKSTLKTLEVIEMFSQGGVKGQTGAVLVRGLLYTSSRNGDQSYSEKYAHGRESVGEVKPSVDHIDVIDVEKFGKRPRSSHNGITRPFQTVRKREEVDMFCSCWQIQKVFTNRWASFQTPGYPPTTTLMKFQYEEMRITCKSGSQPSQ